MKDYDYKALRYAEIYGIIEYRVEGNKMIYTESYPNEGTFEHKVNLDEWEEKKRYEVLYGDDLRYLNRFVTEAESKEHAKTLFRKKYGFNYIKIQYVNEI